MTLRYNTRDSSVLELNLPAEIIDKDRCMEFKNATIKHKANVYHDGKVTSRTVTTATGEMKTLGVMLPGVYHFNTQAPEVIDVLQGRCRVKLANNQNWDEFETGSSISIPGNSHFEIDISELLDYVCHFK